MPVSYTHLDVYKRQLYTLPKNLMNYKPLEKQDTERPRKYIPNCDAVIQLMRVIVTEKRRKGNRLAKYADRSGDCLFSSGYCIVSVSYTHLDVYKRQVYRMLTWNCKNRKG